MKISITLKTDNAAFENDPAQEVSRILKTVIHKISQEKLPHDPMVLKDINGNAVGKAFLGRGHQEPRD